MELSDQGQLFLRSQGFRLEQAICSQPHYTSEDARRFVQFACRCIRETDLGEGKTPCRLLNEARVERALHVAEDWLRGTASLSQLDQARQEAEDVVEALAGPRQHDVLGRAAALWALFHTLDAASEAAHAATSPSPHMIPVTGYEADRANAVLRAANLTAWLARQADSGHRLEAIDSQYRLMREIWPEA